jgi:hypothetical protein
VFDIRLFTVLECLASRLGPIIDAETEKRALVTKIGVSYKDSNVVQNVFGCSIYVERPFDEESGRNEPFFGQVLLFFDRGSYQVDL